MKRRRQQLQQQRQQQQRSYPQQGPSAITTTTNNKNNNIDHHHRDNRVIDKTRHSLSLCLNTNKQLQYQIKQKLLLIYRQKQINRLKASNYISKLQQQQQQQQHRFNRLDENNNTKNIISTTNQPIPTSAEIKELISSSCDDNSGIASADAISNSTTKSTTTRKKRKRKTTNTTTTTTTTNLSNNNDSVAQDHEVATECSTAAAVAANATAGNNNHNNGDDGFTTTASKTSNTCVIPAQASETADEKEDDGDETKASKKSKNSAVERAPAKSKRRNKKNTTSNTTMTITLQKRKQFQYDPNRKWNSNYFIDPLGITPNPNSDMMRRKRKRGDASDDRDRDGDVDVREQQQQQLEASKDHNSDNRNNKNNNHIFFQYTNRPWSKQEMGRLKKLMITANNDNNTSASNTIDWNQIAKKIQQQDQRISSSSSKKMNGGGDVDDDDVAIPITTTSSSIPSRTPKECELASRSLIQQQKHKNNMPKSVMFAVLEKIHQLKEGITAASATASAGDDGGDDGEGKVAVGLDWTMLCKEIQGNDPTTKNMSHITPWQLFTKYQQHWKSKTVPAIEKRKKQQKQQSKKNSSSEQQLMWKPTVESDEFLLRYLAIQGPQFVWDKSEAAKLITSTAGTLLFPNAIPRQIVDRSRCYSVNPNLKINLSFDGQRKLVLLMRIYQNYNEPIQMAATHFMPSHSARQVSLKWERSICPQTNNTKPFTKEEDELLLRVAIEGHGDERGATASEVATTTATAAAVANNDDDDGGSNNETGSKNKFMNFGEISREIPLFKKNCRGAHQLWQRFKDISSPEQCANRIVQGQLSRAATMTTTSQNNDNNECPEVSQQDFVIKVAQKQEEQS